MPVTPHAPSPTSKPSPVTTPLVFVALVALGLLGNHFNYPLFLSINFLFGSIFSMLALQAFGRASGVVAAALIAGYTILLWNHPYYFLIATAEVAVVGFMVHRYRIGLVLADALFWVVLGIPACYLVYHGMMGVSLENTALVMSKSTINGITNTLIARLLYTGFALRFGATKVAYRDITYNLMASFALGPALLLMVVASHEDFDAVDREIRAELITHGNSITNLTNVWLDNRTNVVSHLAEMAATRTPVQMQGAVEQAHMSDANFLRIGLVDKALVSAAFSPLVDELGQENRGRNYADRPFIPQLRQTLKPMLSEMVLARIGLPVPAVLVLAPIVKEGAFAGYVAGILSFAQMASYFDKSNEFSTMRYALIDKHRNVILTNRDGQRPMTPFTREAGTLAPLDGRVGQWVPALARGTPVMQRWKSSYYVTETPVGPMAEWTLVLEQPVAPFQKMLYTRYAKALGLLLLLLAALLLAEFISRRSIQSLERLSVLTHELPAKLAMDGDRIAWPSTGFAEAQQLIDNFTAMAHSLSTQFEQVRQNNLLLESRVEQRTAQLTSSLHDREALLREVHHRVKNNLQVITSLLRLESRRHRQPDVASVLSDMQGRIRAMALLHESLYRSGSLATVDLAAYVQQLATQALHTHADSRQAVQLGLQLTPVVIGMDQAIPCGLLVNELISNCIKHGFPDGQAGRILVVLQAEPGAATWCLKVADTGVGLPPDFEQRRAGSLGLQLVSDLARQLGGTLEIGANDGGQGVLCVVHFHVLNPPSLSASP